MKSIDKLHKMGLIPNLRKNDDVAKCSICAEVKFTRKPFKVVTERSSELLELIHIDLADFKSSESRGGK